MNLIVNVDKNWGIGKNGGLLASIPQDMKYFRKMTTGKVIVMGRKTMESFPNGKPLANRVNIVLTQNKNYTKEGAIIVHDLDELKKALHPYPDEDVFVIGGGSVYKQLLDQCDRAYITKMDHVYDADTYFPNMDAMPSWQCISTSEEQIYYNLVYYFTVYQKKA